MRIFHLSDLHLGKKLKGYDLLEDQEFALERVLDKIREEKPDAILVSGDVYDRAVPPVEAVMLFDRFLTEASGVTPRPRIAIIPGNHDSAGRMAFGSGFMESEGVHIVKAAGKREIFTLERDGATVAFWALPFMTGMETEAGEMTSTGGEAPAAADPDQESAPDNAAVASAPDNAAIASAPAVSGRIILSQQELIDSAIAAMKPVLDPSARNVLLAHCFASGAVAGDSERAFIGMAEQVDASNFRDFDYVALGHLHRNQSPAPHCWYSGSLIQYSVAEADQEKGFMSVEILPGDGNAEVRFVPITPLRHIRRLQGFMEELLDHPLPAGQRDDYIDICLADDKLMLDAKTRFDRIYPRILGIRYASFPGNGDDPSGGPEAGELWPGDDGERQAERVKKQFRDFHEEMKGTPPDGETMAIFEALLAEAQHEAD